MSPASESIVWHDPDATCQTRQYSMADGHVEPLDAKGFRSVYKEKINGYKYYTGTISLEF